MITEFADQNAEYGVGGLTGSARVATLSVVGKLLGISFKVGELPYGAKRISEQGDSL